MGRKLIPSNTGIGSDSDFFATPVGLFKSSSPTTTLGVGVSRDYPLATNFSGIVGIFATNAGNGNVSRAQLFFIARNGAGGNSVQQIGTNSDGSGGGQTFNVTWNGSSLRITNTGSAAYFAVTFFGTAT